MNSIAATSLISLSRPTHSDAGTRQEILLNGKEIGVLYCFNFCGESGSRVEAHYLSGRRVCGDWSTVMGQVLSLVPSSSSPAPASAPAPAPAPARLTMAEKIELDELLTEARRAYHHTTYRGESTERFQEEMGECAKYCLDGLVPELEDFAPRSAKARAMLEKTNKRLARLDAERDL